MCAWCEKQFETETCLEEHVRGVHECNSTVCTKSVHGVGNTLRQGVACMNMAGADMWAVEGMCKLWENVSEIGTRIGTYCAGT